MKKESTKRLRERFKEKYFDEFNDPNESCMDFLLDLIPKKILLEVLSKKGNYYLSLFNKYK